MSGSSLTIGEVAERSGVASSALRFYESKGLIQSTRTDGNQRRFHRSMIRRVSIIRAAQAVGLTLDEIGAALSSLPDQRTATTRDWQRLSRRWRQQLDDRIRSLELLRSRLDNCIGCGCLSIDACNLLNADDTVAAHGSGPRYLLGDPPPD